MTTMFLSDDLFMLLGLATILACARSVIAVQRRDRHLPHYATASGLLATVFFLTAPGIHFLGIAVAVLATFVGVVLLTSTATTPVRKHSGSGVWKLSESGVWRLR